MKPKPQCGPISCKWLNRSAARTILMYSGICGERVFELPLISNSPTLPPFHESLCLLSSEMLWKSKLTEISYLFMSEKLWPDNLSHASVFLEWKKGRRQQPLQGRKMKKGISGELINCHLRRHMLMAGEEWRGKELRPHGKVNTYWPYLTLIHCKFLEAKTVGRSFLYPRV